MVKNLLKHKRLIPRVLNSDKIKDNAKEQNWKVVISEQSCFSEYCTWRSEIELNPIAAKDADFQ